MARTKSLASGRRGPGIFQPVKDIVRLLRKGSVYSSTTSVIFRIAPAVSFASVIMAACTVPVGSFRGVISFDGDFIFFAYVLGAGRFFAILSALDTGSSFEGMGASREALFSMLAEPAFFVIMGSLALLTGHTSFSGIFLALKFGSHMNVALGVLTTFVLVMITMIENSRMPVDDPRTHLELTMIHEVMVLDNSGIDLALIMHAVNLKFAIFGGLIANLFIPSFADYIDIIIFFTVQCSFAVTVGIMESFMARFRMNHNPQFIFILSSVSILIFFAVLLVLGKYI